MKLTVLTDSSQNPWVDSGSEVGLTSIVAWITNKQINPEGISVGKDSFGFDMTDGTRMLFVWDQHGGRVTITPRWKR